MENGECCWKRSRVLVRPTFDRAEVADLGRFEEDVESVTGSDTARLADI